MSDNTLLVVGDRFSRQFRHGKTISISDLLHRLRAGSVAAGMTVSVGQGPSAAQLEELRRFVELGVCAFAPTGRAFPVHAELGVTHKRDAANVMISEPAQAADHQFVVDLLIDERCEVLADHLTGWHIPALVLMEAARQTWTAVTERYFSDGTRPTRFVIGAIESEFHHFVFPFAATLQCQLLSHDSTAMGQAFRCHIKVCQGGRAAADIIGSYRTIPLEVGEKHEQLAGRHMAASEIERLGRPAAHRIPQKEDSR